MTVEILIYFSNMYDLYYRSMATHVSYESGKKLKALSNNDKGEAETTSTHLITLITAY